MLAKTKDAAIGRRVRSVKIGRKDAFEGTIVESVTGGWNVRDDQGRLWLRNSEELEFLPDIDGA